VVTHGSPEKRKIRVASAGEFLDITPNPQTSRRSDVRLSLGSDCIPSCDPSEKRITARMTKAEVGMKAVTSLCETSV
jgi:hypothetical protein